ncbi:MAG: hypothetical protein KF777_24700 [Planctomycetaceae bacterium]|nr:hypothetical protein [Planctomycetaceae bacterium]
MASDPIIYCLENLTDYDQFERFCSDVMARSGYSSIEPLGGTKDKGRDALHRGTAAEGKSTIFAYSVREDWEDKLSEDCGKVRKHGHACDRIVFLTTSPFTVYERDNAVTMVNDEFGWELELYGLERLRVTVAADATLITQHPQIFHPAFFPEAAIASLPSVRDYLVLDFCDADVHLGTWLARRLTLAGYSVWARTLAPIAGASLNDTIESLLDDRAFRLLPVLSSAMIEDADILARCGRAAREGRLLPIQYAPFDLRRVDAKTRNVATVRFDSGWAEGMRSLIASLEATGCPKSEGGDVIALRSFLPTNVIVHSPETIYSNRFEAKEWPKSIHVFKAETPFPSHRIDEIRHRWAFKDVDSGKYLAFEAPAEEIATEFGFSRTGGALWQQVPRIENIPTANLGPELLRKSVIVALARRGLQYCNDRKLLYFPSQLLPSERLYYPRPDGTKGFVAVTGRRKFYRPQKSTYYRYQLAPVTSVDIVLSGRMFLTLRVRVRITDDLGIPYQGRTVNSRRKHLCKSWWNDEWFSRILAVMHHLADGNDELVIGTDPSALIRIAARPDHWEVPVRIDETALSVAETDSNRLDALDLGRDDDDDSDAPNE